MRSDKNQTSLWAFNPLIKFLHAKDADSIDFFFITAWTKLNAPCQECAGSSENENWEAKWITRLKKLHEKNQISFCCFCADNVMKCRTRSVATCHFSNLIVDQSFQIQNLKNEENCRTEVFEQRTRFICFARLFSEKSYSQWITRELWQLDSRMERMKTKEKNLVENSTNGIYFYVR